MIESLCVRIKGRTNNADVIVGVYYRSPRQDDDTDELFLEELKNTPKSTALVLMGDFNLSDVHWEHHTSGQTDPKAPGWFLLVWELHEGYQNVYPDDGWQMVDLVAINIGHTEIPVSANEP
ncbi:hypothetical protein BTVI_26056 [Pitangus sulphuratus]|nr:hypothetical protein BTVI_26056 [Pitangus sulphuratus]